MTDRLRNSSSLLRRLKDFLSALKILLSGKYFLIQMSRNENLDIKAKMTCAGLPYFAQVLLLQAYIKNEFQSTFKQFDYIITADDFIDYMPEVRIVGDNTVKVGLAIYETELAILRVHNTTYLKLKKAPKISKKEELKSVSVIFR